MKQWYIIDRNGVPMNVNDLPERPHDAVLEEGHSFRPWYKEYEHVHIENGEIQGLHAFGDLEEMVILLQKILQHEEKILTHFGDKEDIALTDVQEFLVNR